MKRALLLLLAACGGSDDDLPASWTLKGANVEVVVERKPYRLVVKDGAGKVVVDGVGAGDGKGYGGLGWTSGTLEIANTLSPGYFRFNLDFDPWRDSLDVIEATPGADRLTVVLGGERRVVVTHILGEATVRVEAHVDDAVPAPRAWAVAFRAPAGEGYLGMGERFTRTNFRGLSMYSWLEEGGIGAKEGIPPDEVNPFPNGEPMTYYPVPFMIATGGYGAWLDTTYYNRFDFATVDHPDAWRMMSTSPTLAYEIYVAKPAAPAWPYDLIDQFTARTGRPMLAPKWAFGPRRRVNHGDRQGDVSEIQAMRDLDLAITSIDDAFHFLPMGTTPEQRAGAKVVIAEANALGYKVNGYFNSMYSSRPTDNIAPLTAEGLTKNYFLKNAAGMPSQGWIITGSNLVYLYILDFTSPAASQWYTSLFQLALDAGYSGWMYDFGEYVAGDVVASNGMKGEELHNLYPVLYQKAAHDALEALRPGDWMTFARSGYTGASQYSPTVWGGDPAASFDSGDGLPSMVRAGVNAGISGVPNWGGDIGGYHCIGDGDVAADGELLVRWIQQGSMSPIMQDQDACVGADSGKKASIWSSPEAQAAWKTYARLHTRLFPYIYALSQRASATGAPIMRHVFLEHPDRADLAGVDDAYYLGPSILVAPVVARGARQKVVELPAGRWLEWPAGTLVQGGARVTLEAPLAKLPLLLREDRLVPLLDDTIDTLAEETHPTVVGPSDVSGVLDVVGLVHASASFALSSEDTLAVTVTGAFAAPALPAAASEGELRTCTGCWRRDTLAPGLERVRVSATGVVEAGGVKLTAGGGRRVRWDIYLAP